MSENTNIERDTARLKVWYAGMFFCTGSLVALGIISRDKPVDLYVTLGIIAMLIPPVENLISAIARNIELKKEYEERMRRAAERRARLSEAEKKEQEKDKIRAANELAKRHAAKSESAESV